MKYEEIVELVKKAYENADASHIEGHLAIEFDICGEGAGAFYAEVSNGKLDIQPYNYYDHDAAICVEADVLLAVLRGETTMEAAYQAGKLGIDGSLEAVLAFAQIQTKAKEASAEDVVVETAPVVEEAPVEEAPVEAAPVEEETPVEAAPVAETAPAKKETTSAPAKSAAKKEAKVDPIKAAKKAARAKKKR